MSVVRPIIERGHGRDTSARRMRPIHAGLPGRDRCCLGERLAIPRVTNRRAPVSDDLTGQAQLLTTSRRRWRRPTSLALVLLGQRAKHAPGSTLPIRIPTAHRAARVRDQVKRPMNGDFMRDSQQSCCRLLAVLVALRLTAELPAPNSPSIFCVVPWRPVVTYSPADAISKTRLDLGLALATSQIVTALTLRCADNHLAALRRQCFYLALTPSVVSVRFPHIFRECLAVPYWISLQHGESRGAETI
ncbi:hypothetical protein CI1B_46230 [Bradyrhizobium ivorense]|uniref:Uncharacterized protein n=1 Tax=Bradyrhizobium ivorense TaxID=2511166 RepID=A0A508TFC5_9BRAD|nr:hypothetical protein CI1B_46230 [Bradyrhizobium ivorense]